MQELVSKLDYIHGIARQALRADDHGARHAVRAFLSEIADEADVSDLEVQNAQVVGPFAGILTGKAGQL